MTHAEETVRKACIAHQSRADVPYTCFAQQRVIQRRQLRDVEARRRQQLRADCADAANEEDVSGGRKSARDTTLRSAGVRNCALASDGAIRQQQSNALRAGAPSSPKRDWRAQRHLGWERA